MLELVKINEALEKKNRQLEESNANARAEVENAKATLHSISHESDQLEKQNNKLRKRFAELEKEFKEKEDEHMDGNVLMYSIGWMELRVKAKAKYPDMDLSDIPSDLPLDEKANDPLAPEGSDATCLDTIEARGGDGEQARGDGGNDDAEDVET